MFTPQFIFLVFKLHTIAGVLTRLAMITTTVAYTDSTVHGDLQSITLCPTVLPHPPLLAVGTLRPQSCGVTHAPIVTV